MVELIVVMAIMALLAGIAVPSYLGYIKKAKEQQNSIDARQLRIAVAAMMMEQDIKPDEVAENEVYMSIFWKKLGDKSHPLYGMCPSRWDPNGMISELSVDGDYRITSVAYLSPDGKRETWYLTDEGGKLRVEVIEEQR